MFILTSIVSFLKDKSFRSLLLTACSFIGLDSLYFSLITLTIIGNGGFSPQTDLGKIFNLLYAVIGVALIPNFFSSPMPQTLKNNKTPYIWSQ
jgi:hypothetical protein